jgi:uncharacterized protein YukE
MLPNTKTFFTEVPSHKLRMQLTSEQYQEKLFQAMNRDMALLEKLQYDKKNEKRVGVPRLCHHVMKRVWYHYNGIIAQLTNTLKQRKNETEKYLENIRKQITDLTSTHLRMTANEYIVEFSQLIGRLLKGTAEGFASANGQTLAEEKALIPNSEWKDLQNRPIRITDEPEKWKIPQINAKLYGGQQFERLLSEFKVRSFLMTHYRF